MEIIHIYTVDTIQIYKAHLLNIFGRLDDEFVS